MSKSSKKLYDPEFVSGMFDRMSKTYGLANLITSFGFTYSWRKQCVKDLPSIKTDSLGYDLMSGMGESWGEIQKILGSQGKIIAVDISEEMNRKAKEQLNRLNNKNIVLAPNNILDNDIPSNSADFIISTFGIKTFNLDQQKILAREIARILKPNGSFSLIEISEPKYLLLKLPYMFYLKLVIPIIGRVFLNNAEDYKMLGRYCTLFKDCSHLHQSLLEENLNANFKNYFFGCATGVWGTK